ncbi:MAG: DRTGG domain protein [bacterium]|nr:MAG: DRTGG domain protein [bacterium]
MHKIFISSTGTQSGQSLAAWVMAEIFHSKGMRTGFFKPFVTRPMIKDGRIIDKDALLMKEYLCLQEDLELISPVVPEESPEDEAARKEQLKKIEKSYKVVKEEKDALVIMGSEQIFYDSDSPYLPDGHLVNRFDSPVLLVDKFQSESMSIYSVLAVDSFLNGRVKIVIINRVPPDSLESVRLKLLPLFQERGLPIVLVVPQDRILACLTVRHIVDIVKGDVLTGEERLDSLVESTSISSTHLQGSLNLFRRVFNKIILLGPTVDNSPVHFITPVVTGILLTGGRKPAPIVINTCKDFGIPLISTPSDTFTTMEKIQNQQMHITYKDVYKLKRFLQLMGEEDAIRKIVGQTV